MKAFIILLFIPLCWAAEQTRVYFGTGGEEIYTALLDTETGALTVPEKAAEIPRPGFLALRGDSLYATTSKYQQDGGAAAFSIGADGALTLINTQPSGGAGCCHVSLDKTGKYLLFANYSGGNSGCLPLREDGGLGDGLSLMPNEGSSVHPTRQKNPHPHSIYAGPDNRFVYVPDLGTDEVWTFSFNEDSGEMALVDKAAHPAGGGPRHMKFSRNGKYAYVLSELTLNVVVYEREAETGKLTLRESVSNLEEGQDKDGMSCSEIRVSADGKFLYVANRDLEERQRDSVSVFSLMEDGGVQLLQVIPAEVWIPRNITLSPGGKWLLIAGQKSDEVSVFSVDKETGRLSFTGNKVSVPKSMCVVFKK